MNQKREKKEIGSWKEICHDDLIKIADRCIKYLNSINILSREIIDENFDKMILEEISSDLCQVFGKKVKIVISVCIKGAKS